MRVGFVTPRYGTEVMGGAETGARQLAEHLVDHLTWDVDVYTSCAIDHLSWENEHPVGSSVLNGVTVHRFEAKGGRDDDFYLMDGRLRLSPREGSMRDSQRWVDLNGPFVPDLLEAIYQSNCDVMAFYPYLHYTAVRGIKRSKVPSILHPAAHDEPALYFRVFESEYRSADGLCYHTMAERRLVQGVHKIGALPNIVLGLGIETPTRTERFGAEICGLGDRPYVVSVGRVDDHKGSLMLANFFLRYKQRHPSSLALVFVGPISSKIPEHQDIILTGIASEEDKCDIVGDALVSISPSALESFSLVVLEAWAQGKPVVVNANCAPTREHCEQSGGGVWFANYYEFEAVMEKLIGDAPLRHKLGKSGKNYVARLYRWPELIRRYGTFLEGAAERGKRPQCIL